MLRHVKNNPKALNAFFSLSAEKKIDARYVKSLNKIGYVFFCYGKDSTADERKSILLARYFASLYQFPDCYTIVGIGLSFPGEISKYGYTPTVILLQTDDNGWPQECWQHAKICRDEFGYFKDPIKTFSHEEEYPITKIAAQRISIINRKKLKKTFHNYEPSD